MLTKDKIEVIEKPNSISWDQIKDCLVSAHSVNVEKDIRMRYPTLPSDEIRGKIENNKGKMFVVLDGNTVVGVAGFQIKKGGVWYSKSEYIYQCFAGVRPEYAGLGIYKKLNMRRIQEAENLGYSLVVFDTHVDNKRKIEIDQKNGYYKVDYKRYGDHFNVVMAKWLNDCPFSKFKIMVMYQIKKTKAILRNLRNKNK